MHWVLRADVRRLKPQVIIPMRFLRRTAGMDEVHLSRHLVIGSKPCFTRCRNGCIGKVAKMDIRAMLAKFLQ